MTRTPSAASPAPDGSHLPTVSVVIPVYDVAATVTACIESVAAQTLRPHEVLVVDDRGHDDSAAIALETLRRSGLPHRLIVHDRNRGLAAARNTGLAAAQGELVWFMDSDDVAEAGFLASLVGALVEHDADLAVCRTLRVAPDGTALGIDEPPYGGPVWSGARVARGLLANAVRAYACTKVFRRESLPPDPFPEGLAYEDFVPVLRAALSARRVAMVDEPLYRYTVSPGSISQRCGPHSLDLLVQLRDVGRTLDGHAAAASWTRDRLLHRAEGVVLPLANLALRSEHAHGPDAHSRRALAAARATIRPGDPVRLLRAGRPGTALRIGILRAVPRIYSQVLRRR